MPASTLLRVGRDGSATPVTADRGDKQIGLSNFECAGARQGPFCFACQIRAQIARRYGRARCEEDGWTTARACASTRSGRSPR